MMGRIDAYACAKSRIGDDASDQSVQAFAVLGGRESLGD
jgi:hypothetical protein